MIPNPPSSSFQLLSLPTLLRYTQTFNIENITKTEIENIEELLKSLDYLQNVQHSKHPNFPDKRRNFERWTLINVEMMRDNAKFKIISHNKHCLGHEIQDVWRLNKLLQKISYPLTTLRESEFWPVLWWPHEKHRIWEKMTNTPDKQILLKSSIIQ